MAFGHHISLVSENLGRFKSFLGFRDWDSLEGIL